MNILLIFATLPWMQPTHPEVREVVAPLVQMSSDADAGLLEQVLDSKAAPLDQLVHVASICLPEIPDQVTRLLDAPGEQPRWPVPEQLSSRDTLIANLNLHLAREYVRRGLAEEGLALLEAIAAEQVVAPVCYRFFKAVAHYQSNQMDQAMVELDQLASLSNVPHRYVETANLIRAELLPVKQQSLQSIAHDMRRVGRRLENGQTGEKVQVLANDVVKRLDTLIEELEQQQRQQSASGGDSSQSSGPMEDSRLPAGGQTKGEVGDRALKISTDWGKVPEKEREQALQQLDRRFPGHYREAVEQYFRRLATSESQE